MAKKALKIIQVSSELSPFSRTGGLAEVAASLPKAIRDLGHDVSIITPLYGRVIDKKKHKLELVAENIKIKLDKETTHKVNFWRGNLGKDLPVYFIENTKYFSRRKKLYGSTHENARFMLFDLAAINLMINQKMTPDIVQCHDWQAGLIPQFIKKDFKNKVNFHDTAVVYTVHNLAYQLGQSWWKVPRSRRDDGTKKFPLFSDPKIEYINFAKRAILNADIVSTVSETYVEEIMSKRFGEDLNRILSNRKGRIFGIVNGIDFKEYNPATDPGLYRKFDYKRIKRRAKNKAFVQKYYGLPQSPRSPLMVMASRIVEQKGFDILTETLDGLLRQDVQLIIMGDGNKKYISALKKYHKKYPKKIVWTPFDRKYETSLYAGADMALLPSRFEPCGLVQMISSRYGAVPIVRDIGGLADTVSDYNSRTGKGDGFKFKKYAAPDFLIAISRAMAEYQHEDSWRVLVKHVMQRSTSWEIPARKYIELYRKALKIKKQNGKK
jgi:starch synthase